MLTVLKKFSPGGIKILLAQDLKQFFLENFVGKDEFGNKYYEDKKGIDGSDISNEVDATKIPVEWYSWIHFMPNRIEKNHELNKYEWQKPHLSNQTGTEKAYYPNKDKKNVNEKKYKTWKR